MQDYGNSIAYALQWLESFTKWSTWPVPQLWTLSMTAVGWLSYYIGVIYVLWQWIRNMRPQAYWWRYVLYFCSALRYTPNPGGGGVKRCSRGQPAPGASNPCAGCADAGNTLDKICPFHQQETKRFVTCSFLFDLVAALRPSLLLALPGCCPTYWPMVVVCLVWDSNNKHIHILLKRKLQGLNTH